MGRTAIEVEKLFHTCRRPSHLNHYLLDRFSNAGSIAFTVDFLIVRTLPKFLEHPDRWRFDPL